MKILLLRAKEARIIARIEKNIKKKGYYLVRGRIKYEYKSVLLFNTKLQKLLTFIKKTRNYDIQMVRKRSKRKKIIVVIRSLEDILKYG